MKKKTVKNTVLIVLIIAYTLSAVAVAVTNCTGGMAFMSTVCPFVATAVYIFETDAEKYRYPMYKENSHE